MRRNLEHKTTAFSLILLTALLLAIVSQNVSSVAAQTDVATVIVMPTTGGTTDPAPGMYTYNNGTTIAIKAIPDAGYTFSYWLISGDLFPGHTTAQTLPSNIIDPQTGQVIEVFPRPANPTPVDSLTFTTNPANITCGYGYSYTYTAIFAAVGGPSPSAGSSDATVIVMPTTGGTVSPAAGMYTYPNGSAISLSATPNPGYTFQYWLISGQLTSGHPTGAPNQVINPDTGQVIVVQKPVEPKYVTGIDSLTFTANPTHITCGYGYTYTYTAIFAQAASPTTSPLATATTQPTASPTLVPTASPKANTGTDLTIWIIAAVVVVIVIIIAVAAVMMRRKK
jgi:hypothetical protein